MCSKAIIFYVYSKWNFLLKLPFLTSLLIGILVLIRSWDTEIACMSSEVLLTLLQTRETIRYFSFNNKGSVERLSEYYLQLSDLQQNLIGLAVKYKLS